MSVQIVEVGNPFQPQLPTDEWQDDAGYSVRQILERRWPGFSDFGQPTYITVNGEARMRAEWDQAANDGDIIQIIALPEGGAVGDFIDFVLPLTDFGLLVDAVDRWINGLMPDAPKTPGSLPDADPVYSLARGLNEVRLGEPIECLYGRLRYAPAYAARPYNSYIDNEQWQYNLYCLSHGDIDVEDVYVADTSASDYPDFEYQVYKPGQSATLFPDNVHTSPEVSAVELFAPNEDDYESWRTVVANPAGTAGTRIEIDLTLGSGLYYSNDDGGLSQRTVEAEIQYRRIDDEGNPIDVVWAVGSAFTKTLATVTPQRYTVGINVPTGRYQVRVRRTNNTDNSHRVGDTLHWTALRVFMPSTQDYGDVTLLAVKARATNNLNDQSAARISVLGTRRLPVWDKATRTWSTPVPTRSIVWAFCDVWRSAYGARLMDQYLDLDALYDLDQIYSSRGEYFDHRFRSSSSCWDVARTIARCGRAVPVIQGSQITMVRDAPVTLHRCAFTPDNIVKGSFSWDVALADDSDYDAVEIQYTDPATWLPETVTAVMPGQTGDSPETITLTGCADRTHAWREANYTAARRLYIKETISFTTGAEGFIPTFGTPISVSHPMPRWGQAGLVDSIKGKTVELSDSVEFGDDQHYLVFRKRDGSTTGLYPVEPGIHARQVVLQTDLADELFFSSTSEPPYYMFGQSESWSRICRVISTTPSTSNGKRTVKIVAEGYEAITHSFDDLDVPATDDSPVAAAVPDLPTVTGLTVNQVGRSLEVVDVSWQPALGAQSYRLQSSVNGIDWIDVETLAGTHYTLPVSPGHLYLRVAAINIGQGAWDEWDGQVGVQTTVPYNVTTLELQSEFTGTFCKIQWHSVINADFYRVRVCQGQTVMRTVDVAGQSYTYSIENARQDGTPSRELTFEVVAVNDAGESTTPATLAATNPIPAAIHSHSVELISDDATTVTYRVSWATDTSVDVAGYKAWASTSSGFTPGDSTLVYESSSAQGTVVIDKVGGSIPTYYWHAATVDVWGDEVTLGVEQVLQ